MRTVILTLTLLLSLGIYATAATEITLYSFTGGLDGGTPWGGLAIDAAGNLYGTTLLGGTTGNGVVFQLTRTKTGWNETVIHNFSGPDGSGPVTKLIFDKAGNLYGTTSSGGANGGGTVFELSPTKSGWTEKVLWSFNQIDGEAPFGDLILDNGVFYGTNVEGGGGGTCENGGCGTAFELFPQPRGTWGLLTLHAFTGGDDGSTPLGGMVLDPFGNLYGTAEFGGPNQGSGVVFQLRLSNGSWNERVLFSFDKGGENGAYPTGDPAFDKDWNLYGTTTTGGATYNGLAFELNREVRRESAIYTFTGGTDQGDPGSGLTFDSAGNAYGTTDGGFAGIGTVYQLTPGNGEWTETTLYSFTGTSDGDTPESGVILDPQGNLYGTASGVQGNGYGAVYEIVP